MEQFRGAYIEESLEGLDTIESNLLHIKPGSRDEAVVNTIFRAAHSIKGGGAAFGFADISEFTHAFETLLDQIRKGRREFTRETIHLFLQSVDYLRDALQAAQSGAQAGPRQGAGLKARLHALLAQDGKSPH